MTVDNIVVLSEHALRHSSKEALIAMVLSLREELNRTQIKLSSSQKRLAEKEIELQKRIKKEINQTVNQPSSKQPEYNKNTDSNKKKTGKKKRKNRKHHKGRAGAGNRPKPEPDIVHINPLTCCPQCNGDLTSKPVIETSDRIVEDIAEIPEKTIISKEVQERKWCSNCGIVVSSSSEGALPKSDIGLRTLGLVAYLWVVSAISPCVRIVVASTYKI